MVYKHITQHIKCEVEHNWNIGNGEVFIAEVGWTVNGRWAVKRALNA